MTVPPRLVHLTQGIGSDAPPRRVPQGGGKFAIGQILVGSLQCFIDRCLLYTSPSPRDKSSSRMPSSA